MTDVRGAIHVRVGCMFAGKSTYLIQMYRKYSLKYPTLIIGYIADTRYTEYGVGTHDKLIINDQNVVSSTKEIGLVYPLTKNYQVICIEEAQFYTGLVEFCEKLANEDNKLVIVVGLDGDINRDGFGEIPLLLPKAEKFKKVHAVCSTDGCNHAASFTTLVNRDTSRVESGRNPEQIGGAEIYRAVCRKHFSQVIINQ